VAELPPLSFLPQLHAPILEVQVGNTTFDLETKKSTRLPRQSHAAHRKSARLQGLSPDHPPFKVFDCLRVCDPELGTELAAHQPFKLRKMRRTELQLGWWLQVQQTLEDTRHITRLQNIIVLKIPMKPLVKTREIFPPP
jgi:hypothetical protein